MRRGGWRLWQSWLIGHRGWRCALCIMIFFWDLNVSLGWRLKGGRGLGDERVLFRITEIVEVFTPPPTSSVFVCWIRKEWSGRDIYPFINNLNSCFKNWINEMKVKISVYIDIYVGVLKSFRPSMIPKICPDQQICNFFLNPCWTGQDFFCTHLYFYLFKDMDFYLLNWQILLLNPPPKKKPKRYFF